VSPFYSIWPGLNFLWKDKFRFSWLESCLQEIHFLSSRSFSFCGFFQKKIWFCGGWLWSSNDHSEHQNRCFHSAWKFL